MNQVAPPPFDVFWHNIHQWDHTARGTGLHVNDAVRREIEIQKVLALDAQCKGGLDVVCFGEVWSREAADELQRGLEGRFQYWRFSPFAEGVPAVQRRLHQRMIESLSYLRQRLGLPPTLFPGAVASFKQGLLEFLKMGTPAITRSMGRARYGALFLQALETVGIDEESVALLVEYLLNPVVPWGGGLMMGSKHPLKPLPPLSDYFVAHPVRAGLERQAEKGSLAAVVQHPQLGEIPVVATHLQDGLFPAAVRARMEQVRFLAGLKPAILVGDFNIVAEQMLAGAVLVPTQEYRNAKVILGLRDAYRELHLDAKGYTYDHGAGFARAFGVDESPAVDRTTDKGRARLDFIFYNGRQFQVRECQVLNFVDSWGRANSDHSAIHATF